MRTKTNVALSALFSLWFSCSASYAEFIPANPDVNNLLKLEKQSIKWTFPNAAEAAADVITGTWRVNLASTETSAAGTKDLSFEMQHLRVPREEHSDDLEPNPNIFKDTIKFLQEPPPFVHRANAAVLSHRNGKHFDFFKFVVVDVIGPDPLRLQVEGTHSSKRPMFFWSYERGGKVKVTVTPSYPDGSPGTQIVRNLGGPNEPQSAKEELPDKLLSDGTLMHASDYRLVVERRAPDPTETTLAFIGQADTDAELEQLDLALATLGFVGLKEFLVPSLFNETQDLFVGVDLVQWLSFPTPFDVGDSFDITDGINDLLPGFIIGTSPISFDPSVGFVTANPFDGPVDVIGVIDGQAVPEPPTLALLGTGVIGVIAFGCRRKGSAMLRAGYG